MSRWAEYTVKIVREIGESDGEGLYHDGTDAAAIAQLAAELQEAWDSGAVDGFFRIVDRHVVDQFPWRTDS